MSDGLTRQELVAMRHERESKMPQSMRSGCMQDADGDRFPRWEPPVVAVQHPHERRVDGSSVELVAMTELLHVWCTECGAITDYETNSDSTRVLLQRCAADHSDEDHDGLVEAVGWVR